VMQLAASRNKLNQTLQKDAVLWSNVFE